MARKRVVDDGQMAFDFGFDQMVRAVEALQEEQQDDRRTDGPLGDSSPGAATENHTDAARVAVPLGGMGDRGSLGDELARGAEGPRSGRDGADLQPDRAAAADRAGSVRPESVGADDARADGNPARERDSDGTHDAATGVASALPPAGNYVITAEDRLGQGGPKAKFRDNIAALQILNDLEATRRPVTVADQRVLVRYVGWGGLPQAFDHRNSDWSREYAELAQVLTCADYDAARRSTQDAHYTSQTIVEGMYKGVRRLGFFGGDIIESSVGTGNFVGLAPRTFTGHSKFTGIELDPVSARIAKALYPDATIINSGFQDVGIPEGHFQLAIGNVPFGNQRVFDPLHEDISEFSIHNYFIAKCLHAVHPGGIVAVAVSSYFLDGQSTAARDYIADRAHLLGAVRLPSNAFKENALTEVTADIVFLQRARDGEKIDRTWVEAEWLETNGGPSARINTWFHKHPEMILGTLRIEEGYRGRNVLVDPAPGEELATALDRAIGALPQWRYIAPQVEAEAQEEKESIEIPQYIKVGAFFVLPDGRVARRLPDVLAARDCEIVKLRNGRAGDRIRGMVEIRDTLRELMTAERTRGVNGDDLNELRERLNHVYDRFIAKHGYISSLGNRLAFRDDPEYPLLHSLEADYDQGVSRDVATKNGVPEREPSAKKAAIFSRRVIGPREEVTHAETGKDALLVCLNELGRVDMERMTRLTGKDEGALVAELDGIIFRNPARAGAWETRDQYLSGNVKAKLAMVKTLAGLDSSYAANVAALEGVLPADIEPVDISVQLGSTWVPPSVVQDFVRHLLGKNLHCNVAYEPALGRWMAEIGRPDETVANVQWGTAEYPAQRLIGAILGNKSIVVKVESVDKSSGETVYVVDSDKTTAAQQKADEIRQAFLEWVWEDKTRRNLLARIYNETINTNVPPRYDGSHLTLPGASLAIELRPSQKNAVWRGIQEGGMLGDHVVGGGKTYLFVAVAMESKRMGLMSKPMFTVPNHLLLDWKDAFYGLYPGAKVLVAEPTDFEKENRQRLFSRIATGDWDAVIVGHSSFKKIGMPPAALSKILNEQIEDLTEAIIRLRDARGDRMTIKEMEKARDRMKAKVERMADTGSKDGAVTFDDLGVDALFVDEADEFKNLAISTTLTRIRGLGNLEGSEKAFDLFVKCRYLQDEHDDKGVFMATGTPISNTIAEVYTFQRYLQYNELRARNLLHFDAWASTFGRITTGWELDATGVNYRVNSRFSQFQNVPELIAMYRTFADVVTRQDLNDMAAARGERPLTPRVKGGKPTNIVVERSDAIARYMGVQTPVLGPKGQPVIGANGLPIKQWTPGSVIYRMENLPDDPSEDNPLKITNDARKAALDYRLIEPTAGADPNGKVSEVVRRVHEIWRQWESRRGTQLLFCDLSTPKGSKGGKARATPVAGQEVSTEENEEVVSMDDLLADGSKFSVYDDVKAQLVALGVPEHEIRFMHDCKTPAQKQKLFADMNEGRVRITLSSTIKGGAGTNVQRRLVAEHHIDVPWRPRDVEQREGRIIRQGNLFYEEDPDFEVEIFRYATKQTYDSRMWQVQEQKARAIEQFRRGTLATRVIEDVASDAANAAEMKAAATGNPLIFLQVQLAEEARKMEAVYRNYQRNHHTMESRAEWLANGDKYAEKARTAVEADIARRNNADALGWQFKGNDGVYGEKNRKDALGGIAAAMKDAVEAARKRNGSEKHTVVPVGEYRGFKVGCFFFMEAIRFELVGTKTEAPGNLVYLKSDEFDLGGFFRRIDNVLEGLDNELPRIERQRQRDEAELGTVRAELEKPFKDFERLQLVRADAADVLTELKRIQADESYVPTWVPKSMPVPPELTALHEAAARARAEAEQHVARQAADELMAAEAEAEAGAGAGAGAGEQTINKAQQRGKRLRKVPTLGETSAVEEKPGLPAEESRTLASGKALAEAVVVHLGGTLEEWKPMECVGQWEKAFARWHPEVEIKLAVSGGGVVQVNGDPFTPNDRVMHVTSDAVIRSMDAALHDESLRLARQSAHIKDDVQHAAVEQNKRYGGQILGVFPHHVVQSVGRGAVIHERQHLDRVPNVGESVRVAYAEGRGAVSGNSRTLDGGIEGR